MRTNFYDGSWLDSHPHSSRLDILADAFHADANHPVRRLLLNLLIMFAPVLVVVAAAGAFALAS